MYHTLYVTQLFTVRLSFFVLFFIKMLFGILPGCYLIINSGNSSESLAHEIFLPELFKTIYLKKTVYIYTYMYIYSVKTHTHIHNIYTYI